MHARTHARTHGSQESSHQVALANHLAHSHTHIPRLIGSVACDVGGAVY